MGARSGAVALVAAFVVLVGVVIAMRPRAAPRPAGPLVVFVHERGSFAPDEREANAIAFVDTMQRHGIAVTSVAVESQTPAAEVAGVVREQRAEHVVLVGERRGASIAVELALDPSLGVSRVVTFNGTFDDAPGVPLVPCLILTAHGETPAVAQSSRRFERRLRDAGAKDVHRHHVSVRNERSLTNLAGERNDVADLVTAFVKGDPPPGGPDSAWAIDDAWAEPPLSSATFRATPLAKKPADAELRAHIAALFGERVGDLEPWPAETYDAIDVDAYLSAHPELGSGDWLTVENARGERLVFARADLRRKKAELVVGLDDEPNLFRLFVTYNVYRTYSWKPEPAPRRLLVRPVGTFLHFPDGTRPSATHAEFALTSLRVSAEDPLAGARRQPAHVADVLTNDQGCLECHAFGSANARAHHVRAADGALAEAFALPLAEYPPDVLRRFLFEQDQVAETFGVGPLHVGPATANELLLAVSAH